MDTLISVLLEQARLLSSSWLELAAVILAMAYLLLAIRQNIWCWLCAGISAAIFVPLFAQAGLYMDAALNVFYFSMAIYGWSVWTSGRSGNDDMPVAIWPMSVHARAVAIVAIASLASGYLLSHFTDAKFPYEDSLVAWSSIWATFLVARKVLENWWYWLIIDLASVVLFWSRDLQLTSVLYAGYVIMIPFGLIGWSRTMRAQQA